MQRKVLSPPEDKDRRINAEPLTDGFGSITSSRIRSAVRKFAAAHLKGELKALPLEPGDRLLLSGSNQLAVDYLGVEAGSLRYRVGQGDIAKPLMRASRGLRFDIYVSCYWTRGSVGESFMLPESALATVSGVQAIEMVVHDRRDGSVFPSWLSLGMNKEKLVTTPREVPSHQRQTLKMPERPKATRKSVMPPAAPRQEKETASTLSPSEAARKVLEAAREAIHFAPLTVPEMVTDGMTVTVGKTRVAVSKNKSAIELRFVRNGSMVSCGIDIEQARRERGIAISDGHRVSFNAYPLQGNAAGTGSEYVVVATVLTPGNDIYGSFVFGAS